MTAPECIWPLGALLGEGPVWDPGEGALYFVDIKRPAVHRYHPQSNNRQSWPMSEPIGCIARRRRGGFVAGFKSGFAFVDLAQATIEPIGDPEPERPNNRFNDGKCDAQGRFWAGTMDDRERSPTGWLYRLDPDLSWRRMDGGYVCTNGPAFSPDGRRMYHTDTIGRTVYAFDLSPDGVPSGKRAFVTFAAADGYPDGMTADAEGFVWICHWGGWRLTRFAPDGSVERTVDMPAAQVTSCAFGGAALDTLYITTAAIGLDNAARRAQPLAGGLFALRPGVRGLAAPAFAG
ncbi:MAG: SMP-30/gluconolactonase/LRE family protein [Rhodospirillales bacterium]|nr:SMP-30/gluconolactonase/LRE family protein [Rhodospirillales bacterium]